MVFLGVEPRSVGVVLAEGLCDVGGGGGPLWLKASVMGRRAVPLFSLCPGIRLTTEEKHGEPQSGQPSSPGTARWPDLAVFWGTASAGLLDVRSTRFPRWLQSALGRQSAFRVAVLRGSPHQLTLSRNSRSVLWCGRRRMESPNAREFACYQRTKVRWYQPTNQKAN
jgi:hypothetical protein